MPASIIQEQTGSTAGTIATAINVSLTGTTLGNSLIMEYGNTLGSSGVPPGITSNGSLADGDWTKPDPPAGGIAGQSNTYMACAYVHNIPSGITQLTFTVSAARDQHAIVREVAGLANAAPSQAVEDLTNAASTVTPASASASITSGHFVVGWVEHGGAAPGTISGVSTGWTLGSAPAASGAVHLRDAYQISSAGGTQQAVFSGLTTGVRYTGGLLAFAPAVAGTKTIGTSPTSLSFTWNV
jgi:hypothetical protein